MTPRQGWALVVELARRFPEQTAFFVIVWLPVVGGLALTGAPPW